MQLRTNGAVFALGNTAESGGTWDGNVYRLRTWDRLLTLSEIWSLYENPFQIYQRYPIFGKAPTVAGATVHAFPMLGVGL